MQSRHLFIGFILGALVAGIVALLILRKQKELFHTLSNQQREQIEQQSRLIESFRQNNNASLMSNVLNKVDDDLLNNPNRTLSDETIGRIAALSYALRSHTITEGDSTYLYHPSPERGQLLLMISKMNIDSVSLSKIMSQTTFANAMLREANLKGVNLNGVDLNEADLQGANLEGASLSGAKLGSANLWGANLNHVKLEGAYLKGADLRWAEMNKADLKKADLLEADLTSAKLRNANLEDANLRWTEFNGAFLNEANLTNADLFRTNMKRTQLEGAILRKANLTLANISEANLTGSDLSGANLSDMYVAEQNWLALLKEWHVTGANEFQSKYKVAEVMTSGQTRLQLKKTED